MDNFDPSATIPPATWEIFIRGAATVRRVRAVKVIVTLKGSTHPLLLNCDDGHDYVCKCPFPDWHDDHGAQDPAGTARTILADHIVGLLAPAIDAPVPVTLQVIVSPGIERASESRTALPEGPWHGSRLINGTSRTPVREPQNDSGPNRMRHTMLWTLYHWTVAQDAQLHYECGTQGRVWSFDHGRFFPKRHHWNATVLREAIANPGWYGDCGPLQNYISDHAHLAVARKRLGLLSPQQIARAVAAPSDTWGGAPTMDERMVLADFLWSRRSWTMKSLGKGIGRRGTQQ